MSNFKTIGIIGKQDEAPKVWETLDRLVKYLRASRRRVFFDEVSGAKVAAPKERIVTLEEMSRRCSLVIAVGGDGTLLHAARALAEFQVPLVGINLGRLGFLADVLPKEIETSIGRILAGEYEEEPRHMLRVRIDDEQPGGNDYLALNDVVIHRWNPARIIELETYIEGVFVSAQRSDGIIVATPTGSTAYALSGGGPLLHPALDVLAVVPICPHTLSNRPLVVAGDSHIEIRIAGDRDQIKVTCDGLTAPDLEAPSRVFVTKAPWPARLLHLKGHDHYEILRAKLGWGRRLPCPSHPGEP
ncbi:MAG: NAD(+) kinase [Candidatus Thiosymbion ectosymbiont of Robbea hypermnestra]|nr:NAD(+) kinase [Candidatus Thiosymbion ectosymbiont of Robbea hypermnestra]